MFDKSELDDIRALSESELPQLADVKTLATIREAGGVEREGYADGPTDIPCRLSSAPSLRNAERSSEGKTVVVNPWLVVFPVDVFPANLSEKDRLVIRDPNEGWMRTLEVSGIGGPFTNEVMRKVYCTEIVG